jgi:hypothetical protein
MKGIIGISLAIGVCTGVAIGLRFAPMNMFVLIGAAVIAIVIGTAIAGRQNDNCAPSGAGK